MSLKHLPFATWLKMYGHSVTHSAGDCLQSCQLAGTYDTTPFVRQKNQVSIVTAHNRNLIFLTDTPPDTFPWPATTHVVLATLT